MTVSSHPAAAGSTPPYGNPVVECGGAHMRAQYRHQATVVTISGSIDAENADAVGDYISRFILPDKPFILDISGVDCLAAQGIPCLYRVDALVSTAGVDWALVAGSAATRLLRITNDDVAFPLVDSLREALQRIADDISTRRRLILPLLSKTA